MGWIEIEDDVCDFIKVVFREKGLGPGHQRYREQKSLYNIGSKC